MRREGMPEEMRVNALGLQARLAGQPAQDQERAGPRERSATRVQEELGPMTEIEIRAAAREIAAQGFAGTASDGDDPLLPALADAAHEPLVQVDRSAFEPQRLRDAEPGPVQELDQGGIAELAWSRPARCL